MRLSPGVSPSAMPLAAWQQALLMALWAPTQARALELLAGHCGVAGATPSRHQWRGLAAYRSHASAQATRALGAAYPVLARLLGEENFDALARELWQQHPPVRGDLAQWGASLAALIAQLPDLATAEPYLADLARTEWALHIAAAAADGEPDPASYALLASADPARLRLVLAPGTACVSSPWPVVTLIDAHAGEPPELERAARSLAAGLAESALVWRQGWRPRLRAAQAGEEAFIAAVQDKQSLSDALVQAAGFDFPAWLLLAAQDGLLLRIEAIGAAGG
jgi:hypothetical protein